MDWKRSLPNDLFYLSQNGLVIPRYISKPVFSLILFTFFLLTFCIIAMVIPLGHSDSRIHLPESAHSQFQFTKSRGYGDFLMITYMRENSTIWISDVPIDDPDSPALPCELSCQFQDKVNWIKNLKVSFLQKSYFKNAGYIGNKQKLFLRVDVFAPWGKVISLLKAAHAAGIRDVCFLTEEMICPGSLK